MPDMTDRIAAYVMPTEVRREGTSLVFSATLALRPLADGGQEIEKWPSHVKDLFDRSQKPRDPNQPDVPKGPVIATARAPLGNGSAAAKEIKSLFTARYAKSGLGKDAISTITNIWKVLLQDQDASFTGLRLVLDANKTDNHFDEINRQKAGDASATPSVPDIVAVPRNDLSHLFAMQRAQRIVDSVTAKDGRSAKAQIDTGEGSWFHRPWARPPTRLEKLALAAGTKRSWGSVNAGVAPDGTPVSFAAATTTANDGWTYDPYRYSPADDPLCGGLDRVKQQLVNQRGELDKHLKDKLEPARINVDGLTAAARKLALQDGTALGDIRTARQAGRLGLAGAIASIKKGDGRAQTDDRLALHVASTLDDCGPPPDARQFDDSVVLSAETIAENKWFALQGMPALQRLLHLAVDVEITWPEKDFTAVAQNFAGVDGGFVEIGVSMDGGPTLYTLTKVTVPAAGSSLPGKCWPATADELLEARSHPPSDQDDLRSRATIDQFDGIVDLEAGIGEGTNRIVRFDVDSLDVVAAAESETQRHAAINHVAASLESRGLKKTDPPDEDAECVCGRLLLSASDPARDVLDLACADRKLRTAGMRIVDQWRDSVAVKEIVRARAVTNPGLDLEGSVLDADALTVGFKLDVAIINDEAATRLWSSLTDRRVKYEFPGPEAGVRLPDGVTLDDLVDVFVGGKSRAEKQALRRMLDGVTLNMPTRLLTNADKTTTAFSETILSTWEGDPLSLECRQGASPSDFPLKITFDLDKEGDRPHRLRFGAPYWFGARAAMLAGMSRTVESASVCYEHGLVQDGKKGMALPGSTSELRRHLRFEWIDHPMMATPWGEIKTEFSARGGLDGGSMVVRSTPAKGSASEEEDTRRFGPSVTRRVLFAPAVDLTFAHLHGVFDDVVLGGKESTPPTGMKATAYDAKLGGFPSFVPGAPVEDGSVRLGNADSAGNPAQGGLAVFQKSGNGLPAGAGYYPDPAARQMVIAIRRGGRKGPYLEGKPIIVDLYPDHPSSGKLHTPGYPDAVPVVVTVAAYDPGGKKDPLTYNTLLRRTGRADWTRRIGMDFAPKGAGRTQALEVELRLAPGEDIDLDVWCVPEVAQLAAWFDAPESVALLAAAQKTVPMIQADAVKAVRSMLSAPSDQKDGQSHPKGFVIRRSESVVASEAVREAAKLLQGALLLGPVPGIAALRQIRAVHAVEMPSQAPEIMAEEGNEWPLRILRANQNDRLDPVPGKDWRQWLRTDDAEGEIELAVAGAFLIDQHTIKTLELRFSAVAPRARPIDDPHLGRTEEDRMRGNWGQRPDASVKAPSERLYGFLVDKNGCVTLKKEDIVFGSWDIDLPVGSDIGQVDLLALERARSKKQNGQAGKSLDRYFADGTARRIMAQVAGTSRTANLIPERTIYPDADQRARDELRRIASRSIPESIILRATFAPLAAPPKSLLPAFLWKPSNRDNDGKVRAIERRTRIRIRIDRPWFTSGEDERLGVVLWPPNILAAKAEAGMLSTLDGTDWSESALSQGRIRRAEPRGENDKDPLVDVVGQNAMTPTDWRPDYFSDADLGPGGEFVTRWGSDPIHEAGSLTWFMHAGAFKDVDDWRITAIDSIVSEPEDSGRLWPEEDRYKPRLVENVLMPIPEQDAKQVDEGRNNRKEDQAKKPERRQPDAKFMLVSLVTYAPRFDVDMEQWYVDVEIDPGIGPDPFLRVGLVRFQPHANRRLQVSYPTAEWVQIPGFKRRVTLDVDEKTRTATIRADVPQLATQLKDAPRTLLRATLIEREETDTGMIVERVARRPDGNGAEPYVITVSAEPVASDSFVTTFSLPPESPGRTVSYAVLLEEAYVLPRSTFDKEPMADAPDADQGLTDPSFWQESGPRFAVRLEI